MQNTSADTSALNKATAISVAIDAMLIYYFNETTLLATGGTSFDIGVIDETHVTTIESAQVAATSVTTLRVLRIPQIQHYQK